MLNSIYKASAIIGAGLATVAISNQGSCQEIHPLTMETLNAKQHAFEKEIDEILQRARISSGSPGLSAAIYYNPHCQHTNTSHDSSTDGALSAACAVTGDETQVDERVSSLQSDIVSMNNNSHALSVLQEPFTHSGAVVYEGACGVSNVEHLTPMRVDSAVCIASISKTVTALMCARLASVGLLDLSAPLLPLMQAWWDTHAATMRAEGDERRVHGGSSVGVLKPGAVPHTLSHINTAQLLSHTAGVRHYRDDEMVSIVNYPSVFASLLPFVADIDPTTSNAPSSTHPSFARLSTPPFLYTTHGYTLASAVVEAAVYNHVATQQSALPAPSFPSLVSMLVTDPLQLRRLYCESIPALHALRATEYTRTAEGLTGAPLVDKSNKWGGGGMVADAASVAMIGGALTSSFCSERSWLSRDMLRDMFTPVCNRYGLGWVSLHHTKQSRSNHKPAWTKDGRMVLPHTRYKDIQPKVHMLRGHVVSHAGDGPSCSSYLLVAPQEGISVAILSNQNGSKLEDAALDIAIATKRHLSSKNILN